MSDQSRPFLVKTLWIFIASVTILTGWGLYDYGRMQAGYDSAKSKRDLQQLLENTHNLEQENMQLREKIAIFEGGKEIDRQAYATIEQNMKDLQDEIMGLKQELAFYRGIVSPSSPGLHLQSIKLTPSTADGVYKYTIIVTQISQSPKTLKGSVKISIQGTQKNSTAKYSLAELPGEKTLKFRFKHMQSLQGEFRLPKSFAPLNLDIKLITDGQNSVTVEKSFDWADIVTTPSSVVP